jgi:tRNA 2-thiouridine synthesizing protein A
VSKSAGDGQHDSAVENAGERKWNDEMDARGLFCPEPVMLLHNRIEDLEGGQVLKVTATDPSTTRDIPRFCQFLNHELLVSKEQGGEFIYFIRRGV